VREAAFPRPCSRTSFDVGGAHLPGRRSRRPRAELAPFTKRCTDAFGVPSYIWSGPPVRRSRDALMNGQDGDCTTQSATSRAHRDRERPDHRSRGVPDHSLIERDARAMPVSSSTSSARRRRRRRSYLTARTTPTARSLGVAGAESRLAPSAIVDVCRERLADGAASILSRTNPRSPRGELLRSFR
jgi:hypothetical protein